MSNEVLLKTRDPRDGSVECPATNCTGGIISGSYLKFRNVKSGLKVSWQDATQCPVCKGAGWVRVVPRNEI
jgi:hypothetical protein